MAGVRFWRNGHGEVGSVRIAREVALLIARGLTLFRFPYRTRKYEAKKQQIFFWRNKFFLVFDFVFLIFFVFFVYDGRLQ